MPRTAKRSKTAKRKTAARPKVRPPKRGAEARARPTRASSDAPALAQYRKKRDFGITPEPQGAREVKGDIFVIQKHAATRLHYDFRLALDGTLKSWAVAKGPSLNPNDRRLAAHVEDHPMDYARFEGIIPKGQYGGGTVMVWDFGTWEPIGDPRAGYRKGHLDFNLHGGKLKGRWHLVKMQGRSREENRDYWLLIKGNDEYARDDGDSVLAEDRSVLSKRSMDEIAHPARGEPAVWQSNRAGRTELRTEAQKLRMVPSAGAAPPSSRSAPRVAKGKDPLPDFVPPELATLVDAPPAGESWIHEVKLDGYRLYARIEDGTCALLTRSGLDWSDEFPALARTLASSNRSAAIDGEVVFLDPNGVSDFGGLQDALSRGHTDRVALFAFDLLHLDGHDLRKLPLVERKERLKAFLADAGYDPKGRPAVVYSEHFATDGRRFLESACRMALEGIMSKRADAPYRSGRTAAWVKSKCRQRQEFVIGGFTDRTNARGHIGALVLGYFKNGRLEYAGKVGTGMDTATQARLYKELAARRADRWPFADRPPERSGVTWVRPELVCEIDFHGWTRDGRIRQGSFQGLRLDKKPGEVVREQPAHTADVVAGAGKDSHMAKPKARSKVTRAAGADEVLPAGMPKLTHPDRVLLPEQGLTKRQIVDYYIAVADHMLPHVVDRPLTLIRCTQGQDRCFYQKHPVKGMSEAIRRFPIREKNKTEDYIVVDDLRGVVELVQFGSLEINPWGATTQHIEKPDRIILDLDPDPSVSWDAVIAAMQDVRQALETVGLASFPKTTGGKGLHVTIPIVPSHPWPVVKEFARTFAEYLARRAPERYTTNMSKAVRKGRIFIDYLRNDRGATAVAPFSTRARKGGAVAVPISWREVNGKLDPSSFTADVVVARLKKLRVDPWDGFFDVRQRIDELSPPSIELHSSRRRRA